MNSADLLSEFDRSNLRHALMKAMKYQGLGDAMVAVSEFDVLSCGSQKCAHFQAVFMKGPLADRYPELVQSSNWARCETDLKQALEGYDDRIRRPTITAYQVVGELNITWSDQLADKRSKSYKEKAELCQNDISKVIHSAGLTDAVRQVFVDSIIRMPYNGLPDQTVVCFLLRLSPWYLQEHNEHYMSANTAALERRLNELANAIRYTPMGDAFLSIDRPFIMPSANFTYAEAVVSFDAENLRKQNPELDIEVGQTIMQDAVNLALQVLGDLKIHDIQVSS
ncbi:unnamed protein product [Calicophoron daubneyi]|uniref:Uncharacterized protein n=1 Tax=Calicophoron daubneyi TaxID=300641 RepID=A0AAV2TJL1_CALDB